MGSHLGTSVARRLLALIVLSAAILALHGQGLGQAADGRTLYVSPTGADAGACTKASPCGSFDAAYDKAHPGDTVEIAGGTYATSQVLTGDKGSSTPVVVQVAAGQTALINGSLDVKSDYADVRGPLQVSGGVDVDNSSPADPITGVHLSGISAISSYLQNVRDLVFRNSELAGVPGKEIVMIGALPTSYRITLDNMKIHGNVPVDPDTHLECIFATSVQALTIRNSQFSECGYFDLLIGFCCGAELQPSGLVLENNHFGSTRCFAGSSSCPSDGVAPFSLMLGTRITGKSRVVGNVFDSQPATQSSFLETFESVDTFGNAGNTPPNWPAAVKSKSTRLTTTLTRTTGRAKVGGVVTPALPGAKVTLTLSKRQRGTPAKVVTKQITLSSLSQFATSFPTKGAGTCVATLRFAGNSFMDASNQRRLKFRC